MLSLSLELSLNYGAYTVLPGDILFLVCMVLV